jgi:hypothetical protein
MAEENKGAASNARDGGEGQEKSNAVAAVQPEPKKCRCCKCKKSYFSKPENWVHLGTLIAVGIYTGVSALIWCTNNQQLGAIVEANRISSASFIAAQRAYMAYDGVNYAHNEISPGIFEYSVSPKIGNSGNTPTKDLTIKVNCWLDPKTEDEPFSDFASQKIEHLPGFYGPKAVLQAIACNYTLDQAKAIMNKMLHSYMAADIRYWDFVDPKAPEHVSQFVLEFMITHVDEKGGGLVGGVAQRGHHNCADQACPEN